jgi:hypothetical protein
MATIRQIQNKLCELIDEVVYPNGHAQPSITGTLVKISPGWPISEQLDIDLLAGNSQITVFPVGASDKNTSRFPVQYQDVSINLATIFINIAGNTITLTGTTDTPQVVLIILNGETYYYAVQAGDTIDDVATGLASVLPSATSLLNVITISGEVLTLTGRISTQGTSVKEIKRQTKLFYVSVWTPNPATRDELADAVDVLLGDIRRIRFLDDTECNIKYVKANEQDQFEKMILYRRDLIYSIEYGTNVFEYDMTIGSYPFTVSKLL